VNSIIQTDRQLFELINGKLHNGIFDTIMPLFRTAQFSVPLYVFLFVFVFYNFRKDVWWWAIIAGCTATLSNFISSDIIKENIFRVRPCNDPLLAEHIRLLLSYKPQSSSFTSSHAVNHFALASYFYFTLKAHIGRWSLLFFLWAVVIIYAQVYVGVHFPLDVLCGGMIGFILGYLPARNFNRNYGLA
jgi:membrane-associated phospholipid phosphatase